MEDCGNIFGKQVIDMNKTGFQKPPTRLQKQAPACLQLDQMKAARSPLGLSNEMTSEAAPAAATAIPLLTPLVLSPNPLIPETHQEFVFPTDDNKKAATPPAAAAGYGDPLSTLFALLQNKCVLVNDAQ